MSEQCLQKYISSRKTGRVALELLCPQSKTSAEIARIVGCSVQLVHKVRKDFFHSEQRLCDIRRVILSSGADGIQEMVEYGIDRSLADDAVRRYAGRTSSKAVADQITGGFSAKRQELIFELSDALSPCSTDSEQRTAMLRLMQYNSSVPYESMILISELSL